MKTEINDKQSPVEAERIELHNREMSDILGAPPVWVVRTGGPVFYIIILLLIIGTAFFSYPDTAQGRVTIADQSNVEWVVSRSTGLVEQFFVNDQMTVGNNDTLGLIGNSSSFKDMEILRSSLVLLKNYVQTGEVRYLANFPTELVVGDMKDAYELLLTSIHNCLIYENLAIYKKKKKLVEKELAILKKDEVRNELDIVRVEQKLFDLSEGHHLQQELNRKDVRIAYERLINEIHIWKDKYIIQNKNTGRVVIGAPWVVGQMLHIGDTICSIIADNPASPVGRMILSYEQIPGLSKGNKVILNIDEYPAHLYGNLMGVVDNIAYVPAKKNYAVELALPQPLVTTMRRNLPYSVELHGTAQIVTGNKSVLNRILSPLIENFR